MKTKTILKALAFATLLSTACSRETIDENTDKKGFTLPVTINVTREGDEPASKAIYNEGTKKLEFSTGDQLFLKGTHTSAGKFAGTLEWVSEGTFNGTITMENNVSTTADALLSGASTASAVLLPNGFGPFGYLSTSGSGYNADVAFNASNAFSAMKATAVEQFSFEHAFAYSNGFALSPRNAILNFTIAGLTANATYIAVSLTGTGALAINNTVNADGSGNATFAVGIDVTQNDNLNKLTLTVGGTTITLGEHTLAAGKIYNVTRNSALANTTAADVGKRIGADGRIYANEADATGAGTTAVAVICYVGEAGSADASSATYKGLALALTDAGNGAGYTWCSQSASTCLTYQYGIDDAKNEIAGIRNTNELVGHGSHVHAAASAARNFNGGTHPTGTSAWFLPSVGQWEKMTTAAGGYLNLNSNAGLTGQYWSSTEHNKDYAYEYHSGDHDLYFHNTKTLDIKVRACLAF